MDIPASRLTLRLVRDDGPETPEPPLQEATAADLLERAREIARANRAAAAMSAEDARRIFALRVFESLEAGAAGVLRPDRRRELVSAAQRLGLRAFDANLIIAIVQDDARRGETALSKRAAGLVAWVVGEERLGRRARRRAGGFGAQESRGLGAQGVLMAVVVAIGLAFVGVVALISWIVR